MTRTARSAAAPNAATPEAAAAPPPTLSRIFASVLLPFALAHCVSFLYRNVNTVVYPDLVRDVGLHAGTLGLLTSAYFFTFALAQLPVGMALDRWGPRRVQVPMLALAALGGLLFASAHSVGMLVLARALIGLGVAASLMAAIKASAQWLPPSRLPLATSLLMAVGGVGAVLATAPTQWVLGLVGWRGAFVGMALLSALVALLIHGRVPEHPAPLPPQPVRAMLASVRQVFATPLFWRLVLCTVFSNATGMAVLGLWLAPWLRDVAHLPRAQVAQVLLWCALAMVAGTVLFGMVTDRLQRHGIRPVTVCGAGILLYLLCQALMLLPQPPAPALLVVVLCFVGASTGLNYSIIAQTMPSHLTGRVSTSFNLLIFVLAFALQWGLGAVIALWPADASGAYPAAAYRAALGLALALQVPGVLVWLTFKPWQRAAISVS